MDILQYLIELLKIRKEIGIEGLGTLYKKKTPGRYDAENHAFLPPSYVLEFTPNLTETHHLVQYIQTKRGISKQSAGFFITQFADEIKQHIADGNGYTLENLGTFNLENDTITFVPHHDVNIGFDFYALPPVSVNIKTVEDITESSTENNITEEEDSTTDAAEVVTEVNTLSETPPEEIAIEQVVAPDFEQEMQKIATETLTDKITVQQDNEPENEIAVAPPEAPEVNHDENVSQTIENNQPTDTEVFEEINEVNIESLPKDDTDTWDFDDEHVVSTSDIIQEEAIANEYKGADSPAEDKTDAANYTPAHTDDDLKITTTTHDWDFDNANQKDETTTSYDNTLVGEFDQDETEPTPEVSKKLSIYQKLGIAILILLLIGVVIYFVNPEMFQNFSKNENGPHEKVAIPIENSNLKNQQDSLSFADSIMQNAEKAGLEVEPAKDTLKVTTEKTALKPTYTYTYDIIITSFAKNSKAQEYISLMKKKGFDAKISAMKGTRKNISIATYNNVDSAEKYVIKFRKQFKNPEIYIQPIKTINTQ